MDVVKRNRQVWDDAVEHECIWTIAVSEGVIAAARQGDWQIFLTESKPVPRSWFPDVVELDILCLASGGGRQAPILAAAGAHVTVLDISSKQLGQDRFVAERDDLTLATLQADMCDPFPFADLCFDLIVHPVSNAYIPDVRPLWKEAYRLLRMGGALLAGFQNSVGYLFDPELIEHNILQVKYALPYSDLTSITAEEHRRLHGDHAAYEFGHMLQDQIGGQLEAGFLLAGFYEDYERDTIVGHYMPTYIATRALKL